MDNFTSFQNDAERLNEMDALWQQLKRYDEGIKPLSPRSFKWGRHYRCRCCYLFKEWIKEVFHKYLNIKCMR